MMDALEGVPYRLNKPRAAKPVIESKHQLRGMPERSSVICGELQPRGYTYKTSVLERSGRERSGDERSEIRKVRLQKVRKKRSGCKRSGFLFFKKNYSKI